MNLHQKRQNIRNIPPDLIIIITEGEKTEPAYFKKFPLHVTKILTVIGTGKNTKSLINEAQNKVKQVIYDYKEKYGEEPVNPVIWCVFDKDDFPAANFNTAILMAKNNGFKVAYSNEAFELWYLLHFEYIDTALTRKQYIEKLNKLLKSNYNKNDPAMYEKLLDKQKNAIKNAKKLLSSYNPVNPAKDNPSTTIFELVEYLNQFIR
ncbi:MAG TPA: RloB family protein [Candidatus Cloacimonadota bacterium]|nr:RloB family protein [Candidatus Cloacimonadota bacterium]HQL14752.1 RloB family protein [Candidatus Cloacimonadota bacterium]